MSLFWVVSSQAVFITDLREDVFWFDINKKGVDDDKSCTVYAIMSAVATAAGFDNYSTPEFIASEIIRKIGNRPMSFIEVWEAFWGVSAGKEPTTPGEYYSMFWSIDSYAGNDYLNMTNRIMGAMYEGHVVLPMLKNPEGTGFDHIITAYGIEKNKKDGKFYLYYTDSDTMGKSKIEKGLVYTGNGKTWLYMSDGSTMEIFGYVKIRIKDKK
jgi:hypothetical protein